MSKLMTLNDQQNVAVGLEETENDVPDWGLEKINLDLKRVKIIKVRHKASVWNTKGYIIHRDTLPGWSR